MEILRFSSTSSRQDIAEKCSKAACAALSPISAGSEAEIRLAYELAERSFAQKTNLARTLGLEFLLWISGEREIGKALARTAFSPDDFILVTFSGGKKEALGNFSARAKPLALEKRASALALERISLSRI